MTKIVGFLVKTLVLANFLMVKNEIFMKKKCKYLTPLKFSVKLTVMGKKS